MSWFDDVFDFFGTKEGNITGALGLSTLLNLSGLNKPNIPQSGYAGGIPTYSAVRRQVPLGEGLASLPTTETAGQAPVRVPMSYDPNRRPGSSGRRYFTDVEYVTPGNTVTGQDAGTGEDIVRSNVELANERQAAQAEQLGRQNIQNPARRVRTPSMGQPMAAGGIVALKEGMYLDGQSDGMADKVEAVIDGDQPAALSDGEYVIPADVVSHLGNGNSDAGAKVLDAFLDKVRKTRTGKKQQAPQVNPKQLLPA
jgi:hypothetical protein